MAELKTKKTTKSVKAFIDGVADDARRKDCRTLMKLMRKVTGKKPAMWGPTMVGFGSYHYKYASGREGEWFATGFSPRRQNLTLYIMSGLTNYDALLRRLGKFTTGKSCLYMKRLADVDLAVLEELITSSVKHIQASGR